MFGDTKTQFVVGKTTTSVIVLLYGIYECVLLSSLPNKVLLTCVSERSISLLLAPDGNRTHNLLITGKTTLLHHLKNTFLHIAV